MSSFPPSFESVFSPSSGNREHRFNNISFKSRFPSTPQGDVSSLGEYPNNPELADRHTPSPPATIP